MGVEPQTDAPIFLGSEPDMPENVPFRLFDSSEGNRLIIRLDNNLHVTVGYDVTEETLRAKLADGFVQIAIVILRYGEASGNLTRLVRQ